jgi:hypothetical protein
MNNSLREEWLYYNAAVEALDQRILRLKGQPIPVGNTERFGEFSFRSIQLVIPVTSHPS